MLAILISTFDRYKELARWTAAQIERQWPSHPPLFFSGLSGDKKQSLGFSGDSSDWMGVTLEAVQQLLQRGFTYAYFILDDHPPVGPCHEEFLNQTLPQLAQQLDAACIGLLGYGQHRKAEGTILGKKFQRLEECSLEYRWKFSLHPGLWKLADLQALLLKRRELYLGSTRTIWNFERHRDDVDDPIIGSIAKRCFRICGETFLKEPITMKTQISCDRAKRFVADMILFGVKCVSGVNALAAIERKLLWRYGHYLGPYPLFWSGVMQQGKPHVGWEKWLRSSHDQELKTSWLAVRKKLFAQQTVTATNFFSALLQSLRTGVRCLLSSCGHALGTLVATLWKRPALDTLQHPDLSVHLLVSSKTWHAGLLAAISFEFFTGRRWNLFIHEDGSVDAAARARIEKVLPGVRFVSRAESEERAKEYLKNHPACWKHRGRHNLFLKFFDVPIFALGERFIFLDSDVLFFRKPQEILKWADSNSHEFFYNEDSKEKYSSPRGEIEPALGVKLWPRFNSGLMLVPRQAISLDLAEKLLTTFETTVHHPQFFEQTLYALMASAWNRGGALPPTYEISWGFFRQKNCIARHYVGAFKHDILYLEGPIFLLRHFSYRIFFSL